MAALTRRLLALLLPCLLLQQLVAAAASSCSSISSSGCCGGEGCSETDGSISMLQKRAHSILSLQQHNGTTLTASSGKATRMYPADDAVDDGTEASFASTCASRVGKPGYFMKIKSVVSNNLGGFGPDFDAPKELRLRVRMGFGDGKTGNYDIIIKNRTTYIPKDPKRNGMVSGAKDFFQINTRGQTDTAFQAFFVNRQTKKKEALENFYITWYDIDHHKTTMYEHLMIKDFAKFTRTPTTSLKVANVGQPPEGSNKKFAWKMFRAKGMVEGTGVDFNPDKLTRKQFDVSLLIHYKAVSKFNFRLKTTGSKTVGRSYMFSGTTALFGECRSFDCDLWGDPHISSFDNTGLALDDQVRPYEPLHIRSFDSSASDAPRAISLAELDVGWKHAKGIPGHDLRAGDMWLVKSADVHIQGRFGFAMNSSKSFLKAVAIGGPFLEGNSMVLGTNDGTSLWNNMTILTKVNTSFTAAFANGTVSAHYKSNVQHIHVPNRTTSGLEVSLPAGVELLLNRFDTWLGLRIHMAPRTSGQDGECGNFNGNPDDDALSDLQQRMELRVADSDLLFHMPYDEWQRKMVQAI
mmetsp:Transcript_67438/g.161777  ORF Transcript_67438/g.161777 Transcript_67438/m.161777 type:complete len:578 (+) Transcript_67438:175-1908(+)